MSLIKLPLFFQVFIFYFRVCLHLTQSVYILHHPVHKLHISDHHCISDKTFSIIIDINNIKLAKILNPLKRKKLSE